MDFVPLVAWLPDQAPEAVEVLVEDRLSVEPLPLVTLVGFALIETVGGSRHRDRRRLAGVPPAPVQVRA